MTVTVGNLFSGLPASALKLRDPISWLHSSGAQIGPNRACDLQWRHEDDVRARARAFRRILSKHSRGKDKEKKKTKKTKKMKMKDEEEEKRLNPLILKDAE